MKDRKISPELNVLFETPSMNHSEWFGYYNYDTLSADHTKLLCGRRSKIPTISKTGVETIELGYYDIPAGVWHQIDFSDSWSGAQGAMLQWILGSGDQEVIYNLSKNGHLISRIRNIFTNEYRDLDWSIYDITPDGKYSISLDFERSYWCRAYHYQSVANPSKDGAIVEGDGIYKIDLQNNTRKLLIDIHQIVSIDSEPEFECMKHWVEHVMISPNGKRFCFLHRFSPVDNIFKYETRLFIADIDGSNLTIVPGWKNYSWSHFGWQDDNNFVIYSVTKINIGKPQVSITISNNASPYKQKLTYRSANFLKKIVKMILPMDIRNRITNCGYQHYKIEKGCVRLLSTWNNKIFNIDGHPSFTSDGRYMITDTYADNKDYRRFIIYNTLNGKGILLARIPDNTIPLRCDLHPKLSRDNQYVVFDNTSLERQSMMVLKIDWSKIKKKIG